VSLRRLAGPTRRSPHRVPDALRKILVGPKALPSPEGAAPRLQRRGLGPNATTRQSGAPQAVTPMGGTLRRGESAQALHLQAGQLGRRRTHQSLEHPAATSLLPLERISSSFCKLRTQHPSWLYRCKSHRVNKVKGQLGFPQESQVTLVGYYKGHPSRKMVHFFTKTRKHAKYTST
jgi:hypothetical protein